MRIEPLSTATPKLLVAFGALFVDTREDALAVNLIQLTDKAWSVRYPNCCCFPLVCAIDYAMY